MLCVDLVTSSWPVNLSLLSVFLLKKMNSTLLIPSPNSRSVSLKEGLVGKEKVSCSPAGRREARIQQLAILGILWLAVFVVVCFLWVG